MDVEIDHFGGQSGCEVSLTALSYPISLCCSSLFPLYSLLLVHMNGNIINFSPRKRIFIIFMASWQWLKVEYKIFISFKRCCRMFLVQFTWTTLYICIASYIPTSELCIPSWHILLDLEVLRSLPPNVHNYGNILF